MNTIERDPNGNHVPILLIAGSPSAPSRSARLLDYFDTLLAQAGYRTDRLIVRDLSPKALLHADFEDPLLRTAQKRVAQSQAVVLGTPVYKAAYSGILKAFLDLLPQDALAGKAALAIVTGGNAEHRTLTDFAMRQLLSALSASQVLPTVFVLDKQIAWSPEIGLSLDPDIEQHIQDRLQQLHERLHLIRRETEQHDAGSDASHRSSRARSS